MGTITERKTQEGVSRFTAQIRLKKDGQVVHTEARTFAKRKLAETWMVKREAALALGQRTSPIDNFLQDRREFSPIQKKISYNALVYYET